VAVIYNDRDNRSVADASPGSYVRSHEGKGDGRTRRKGREQRGNDATTNFGRSDRRSSRWVARYVAKKGTWDRGVKNAPFLLERGIMRRKAQDDEARRPAACWVSCVCRREENVNERKKVVDDDDGIVVVTQNRTWWKRKETAMKFWGCNARHV